jgi:hypothetical protein
MSHFSNLSDFQEWVKYLLYKTLSLAKPTPFPAQSLWAPWCAGVSHTTSCPNAILKGNALTVEGIGLRDCVLSIAVSRFPAVKGRGQTFGKNE